MEGLEQLGRGLFEIVGQERDIELRGEAIEGLILAGDQDGLTKLRGFFAREIAQGHSGEEFVSSVVGHRGGHAETSAAPLVRAPMASFKRMRPRLA